MSIIVVKKHYTDKEMENRLGDIPTELDYDRVISTNADIIDVDAGKTIACFRSKVVRVGAERSARDFQEAVKNHAKKLHENRGVASGKLNYDKLAPHARDKLVDKKVFRATYRLKNGQVSKTSTTNQSQSNIIGFYDKKDRNDYLSTTPCRLTMFNKKWPEKFEKCLPWLQQLSAKYKKILPGQYKICKDRCDLTPDYTIPETCFTTVTVNYSFETALHYDRGDFGYAMLSVVKDKSNPNEYTGCLLVFPQYRIAFDIQEGDMLVADTHNIMHGNTEFKPVGEISGNFSEREIKNHWCFNRISMVGFVREGMKECAQNKKKI